MSKENIPSSEHVEKVYRAPASHNSVDNDDESFIDIRATLLMLWRRKFVIFSIVIIGLLLTILALSTIRPQFTARSLVLVEGGQKNKLPEELKLLVGNMARVDSSLVLNEIEVMRSRSMARKVIERLELLTDPDFNRSYKQSLEQYAPELLDRTQSFKTFTIYKSELDSLPPELVDYQINQTITNFLDNLRIRAIPGSYAIQIQYTSSHPTKSALIANTVADVYIEERLQAKFQASRKLTDWLDQRLQELREQVRTSELAVAEYKARNNLTEGIRSVLSAEQVSQINTQLINAKAELAEAQARLKQIRNLIKNNSNLDTSGDVIRSSFVQRLKTDEANLMRTYSDLSERYGERHPKIITVRAELQNIRDKIRDEMSKVAASIENEVEVSAARVSALEEGLNELRGVRNSDNENMIKLNELTREAASNRLIFETFMETYKRSNDQEELQEAEARVLSYAAVPNKPSYPDRLLFLSLGMTVSLFFGIFLSFILEKLDNKFRSAGQLEKHCGYPCYALIPMMSGMNQKQLAQYVLDKPSSALSEAVRTLRTVLNLRAKRGGKKPRVITITSSFPGEGKTTMSCWLGRLAAKSGDKVILIDCDLRRPNVHKTLGHDNNITLIEYLSGKNSLKETIHTDDPSGLHVIYSKSVPNSALDLVSSEKMETLIGALKKEYDLVIIDSPACLAVSDARILATYSDQTLYAVAWNRTPREVVIGGVKQFSDMGYNDMAFMLTNVDVKRHVRYGYGDTVYYYGNYHEE